MTVLAGHLDNYLQLRRTLGHKLADAHRLLPRFVAYLDAHDAEFVTIDAALRWALEREMPAGSVVPADRMMLVRGSLVTCRGSIRGPRSRWPERSAIRDGGGDRSSTATTTCSR